MFSELIREEPAKIESVTDHSVDYCRNHGRNFVVYVATLNYLSCHPRLVGETCCPVSNCTRYCMRAYRSLLGWRLGVVVSGVRRMNEVNSGRARLVLRWVTVFGRLYHLASLRGCLIVYQLRLG